MDDANRPKTARQSRADELRARAEQDAWERYYWTLRGAEALAFSHAILAATTKQQHRDAIQPWRDLFLQEEALKASPMHEALAVIKCAASH